MQFCYHFPLGLRLLEVGTVTFRIDVREMEHAMSFRTVVLSSFEEYCASADSSQECAEEERDRLARLVRFPHAVMLQVAFPELDFANRMCWQRYGPSDGDCLQHSSEYCVCSFAEPHSHSGKWTWYWVAKTDYNFGFCEWYFAESGDRDSFLASVDEINWGEKYPK